MNCLKKIIFLLLMTMLVIPHTVFAQEAGRLGYVNLGRVFFEYEKSKELKKTLEDKAKKKDAERKKMVDEIKRFKDETELLSEKARAEKVPQVDKMIKDLQEFDTKTKENIAKESSESSQIVFADIEKVVNGYAKKENYSMIIDTEALLYGDDASNLTDTVIKILNDSYAGKSASPAPPKKDEKK